MPLKHFFVCMALACGGCGPKISAPPAHDNEPRQVEFTVANLKGGSLTLEEYRGRFVLLHFWASWCIPCRTELSELQHFYQSVGPNKLAVIAIAVESDWSDVDGLVKALRITYPVGFDRGSVLREALNVSGVPVSFLVDRSGRLAQILDPADMQLKPSLAGPRQWAQPSIAEAYRKLIKLD